MPMRRRSVRSAASSQGSKRRAITGNVQITAQGEAPRDDEEQRDPLQVDDQGPGVPPVGGGPLVGYDAMGL